MFNTIGRAQGWSDTPLTDEGERGIRELGLGLKDAGIDFKRAYSSDSGRTIQTMGIILEELGLRDKIPYRTDKRIREWCFGSFDGAYDGELFMGVMPRVFHVEHVHQLSYPELAEGLVEVDTAGWAESWPKLSGRILDGFESIAKEVESLGGGNALIVSHGMTIRNMLHELIPDFQLSELIGNASLNIVEYSEGKFNLKALNQTNHFALRKEAKDDDFSFIPIKMRDQ